MPLLREHPDNETALTSFADLALLCRPMLRVGPGGAARPNAVLLWHDLRKALPALGVFTHRAGPPAWARHLIAAVLEPRRELERLAAGDYRASVVQARACMRGLGPTWADAESAFVDRLLCASRARSASGGDRAAEPPVWRGAPYDWTHRVLYSTDFGAAHQETSLDPEVSRWLQLATGSLATGLAADEQTWPGLLDVVLEVRLAIGCGWPKAPTADLPLAEWVHRMRAWPLRQAYHPLALAVALADLDRRLP